jgi:hypothetical protein
MCVWNDTLIEGWIYVEQNITSSFPITTSSSSLSTATTNSTPTENSATTYTYTSSADISTGPRAQVTAVPATPASASSSQTVSTTTVTKESTQTSWNGRGPPNKSFDDDDDNDDSSQTNHKIRKRQLQKRQSSSSGSSSSSATATDSDGDNDDGNEMLTPEQEEALDTYHGLPPYPYLIKIEERRVPEGVDGNVPYCQQFQLLNSGELVPFTDGNYPNGIKFDLTETPPAYSAYDETASVSMKARSRKRQSPANACHCEWWAE